MSTTTTASSSAATTTTYTLTDMRKRSFKVAELRFILTIEYGYTKRLLRSMKKADLIDQILLEQSSRFGGPGWMKVLVAPESATKSRPQMDSCKPGELLGFTNEECSTVLWRIWGWKWGPSDGCACQGTFRGQETGNLTTDAEVVYRQISPEELEEIYFQFMCNNHHDGYGCDTYRQWAMEDVEAVHQQTSAFPVGDIIGYTSSSCYSS